MRYQYSYLKHSGFVINLGENKALPDGMFREII